MSADVRRHRIGPYTAKKASETTQTGHFREAITDLGWVELMRARLPS
jgi:hypothetical protein